MAKDLPRGRSKAPKITTVTKAELEALLASLEGLLPAAMYEQVAGL